MTATLQSSAAEIAELAGRPEGDHLFIDVRTPAEYESAHIPGSYNVPLNDMAPHAQRIADLDRPIVLVCQSGQRATTAQAQLDALGASTQVLAGGIAAWNGIDADVEVGDRQVWAMDRQVRMVAGSISLAGIVVSTVFPPAKWAAGFVASGLVFSGASNTCAMANVLGRLPYNRTGSHDTDEVIAAIETTS